MKVEKNEIRIDEDRRKSLKKLGTYACASAVMISLVASKKAYALSPPPPP